MKEGLKRGQRPADWKNRCPKFKEYYSIQNPEWSEEECIKAAKKYCKEINWQCIEFYQKKYPDKTLEECENLRKEAVFNKRCNSQQYIEYYEKRFPDATPEERLEMLNKYTKENSFQNIEYYEKRFPDATPEERLEMLNNAKKNYLSKRPDNSGENNPAHKSKTSELERRQRSPKCIEFYQLRYPELSIEEYENMVNEHKELTSSRLTPDKYSTKIEYWLAKGYSIEEAQKKLDEKNKERSFTLEKCIRKYGVEEGTRKFNERQEKWMKSFSMSRKNNIIGGVQSSNIADNFFQIIESLKCTSIKGIREMIKGRYSFDYVVGDKIIEFNGDYWHANPKIYEAKYLNKVIGCTAKEIWARDKKKKKYIEKLGYKLLYVWEYDYKNNPEEIIKKCIKFLTT